MLSEEVELTYSHVELGGLREAAAMELFAAALARRLTQDTGIRLPQVTNVRGQRLYPAYYHTHLRVPAAGRLDRFGLWDRVTVAVEAASYGGILIEGRYALGAPGEIGGGGPGGGPGGGSGDGPDEAAAAVTLHGSSMFVVEGMRDEPEAAPPRAGQLAALPRLADEPEAMERFRAARGRGIAAGALAGPLASREPIRYRVRSGRDAAPGRNLLFARFVDIFDWAERELLERRVWPPFPAALLDSLAPLERELFYFGNCGAGEELRVVLAGRLAPCPSDLHGADAAVVSAGLWEAEMEVYEAARGTRLASARVHKLFAVSSARQSALRDAERLVAHHGQR
jgi:probable biosynthetic protein (TIGR04098 family)